MTSLPAARPVLVDRLPLTWIRTAAIVLGAAVVTGLFAQIRVPLPFTPVPIVGTTFAVLLAGAALGPLRGMLSQLVYLSFGLLGLPLFAGGADGGTGVAVVFGASGGYFLGFVVAAAIVGACARRGMDRSPAGMAAAFALGSAAIYLIGAPWLAVVGGYSAGEAVTLGVAPFLVGDAVKAALAGVALPLAWRLLGEPRP
jgi:biotin transport system substrate-specific component